MTIFKSLIKKAFFVFAFFAGIFVFSQKEYEAFYNKMDKAFPNQRLIEKEKQNYLNLYKKTHNIDYLAFPKIIDVLYIKPEDSIKDLRKSYEIIKTFAETSKGKAEGYRLTAIFLEKSSLDLSRDYLERAAEINLKNQNFFLLSSNYHILGRNYYKRGKYLKAIEYYNKALQYYKTQKNPTPISSMYNNFGLAYAKMKNYPLAIKSAQQAIAVLSRKKAPVFYETEFLHNIMANLGNYYFETEDYKNALSLYERVFAFSQKTPKTKDNLQNIIQNMYTLYQSNPEKLSKFVSSLSLFLDNNNDNLLNIQILKILQKNALERGNIQEVKNITLRLNHCNDINKSNLLKRQRQTAADLNKYLIASIENEQYITKQTEKIKNIILYFVLLAMISGIFYLFKINRLNKEKAQIKNDLLEKEKGLILERMQHLNLNLDLKSKTEQEFLFRIKKLKKEKKIDTEEIIKDLHLSISGLLNIDQRHEIEVQKKNILNENFTQKLKEDFPELSAQELQLCGYLHLSLSNKEIALLQNLTPPSVRVYKTRLKAKLGLSKDQDLEAYLKTMYS